MISIFYDLETSSQHVVGQILNYAFVCVDKDFALIDSCKGDVKISRIQLPEPGAILANRIDVLAHQDEAVEHEWEAMNKIRRFIDSMLARFPDQPIALCGYNSSRFDLPYLRTSMIRNGVKPYFDRRLINCDLLHVVRKLSTSDKNFPRISHPDKSQDRLSLKLETLTSHFGLLEGKQLHSSYEDVLLTIDLAQFLYQEFGLDVRSYNAYEAANITGRGQCVYRLEPQYDLHNEALCEKKLYMLIDNDHRSSLWLHVARAEEEGVDEAVRYVNKHTSAFYLEDGAVLDSDIARAEKFLSSVKKISLSSFFQKSTCDIEQDIYRLDFDGQDYIRHKIWNEGGVKRGYRPSKDAKVLLARYKLNAHTWGKADDSKVEELLGKYARYRYGGKLQLWKQIPDEAGEDANMYYPTFEELQQSVYLLSEDANTDDKLLLQSLASFYEQSDLFRVLA